jgi:hypothetical protein
VKIGSCWHGEISGQYSAGLAGSVKTEAERAWTSVSLSTADIF